MDYNMMKFMQDTIMAKRDFFTLRAYLRENAEYVSPSQVEDLIQSLAFIMQEIEAGVMGSHHVDGTIQDYNEF